MYYTLGRVWIEAMRIDDAEQINLFGITTRLNVWTSIFVFVAALIVFVLLGLKAARNRTLPSWRAASRQPSRTWTLRGKKRHRSAMRTLLSRIVNRVIISHITKMVPGSLPPQRKRNRHSGTATNP
ncbi:prolipoprotein diacylglyceryl transferase [Arthrobacter sp. Hiyo4]|nr:prolipoprotein diacylglyceryl transferase [Arthrobacter sp. Hiyo4]